MGFFGVLFSLLTENVDLIVFLHKFEPKLYLSMIEVSFGSNLSHPFL